MSGSFTKRFTSLLLLCVVLLTGITACRRGEAIPVNRIPPATVPVEPEIPEPMPTAPPPAANVQLSMASGSVLSGRPPYSAHLAATFSAYHSGIPAPCTQLTWLFGDGTEASEPCPIETGAPIPSLQTKHRYEQPGIYHASAEMTLVDGRVVESQKTQTVIVATPQPPSLRTTIIRWLAWVVLLTSIGLVVMWLFFQHGRVRLVGAGLLLLFLITFVPPFSYVPDPLGAVLALTGGYRYDPRLPLVNRFLIAGDPTEPLRPTLDGLLGLTGLDPLDPTSPLAHYDFVKVVQQPYQVDVDVRFTYADGSERTYTVPLRQPADLANFYACCWRYDGLGRLRTAHRALPPVPFAESAVLSRPQRLALPAIDSENHQNWFHAGNNHLNRRLVWSPEGDAFLTVAGDGLWLLSASEGQARRVATKVWEYAWLPNGETFLYSTVEQPAQRETGGPLRQIYLANENGSAQRPLLSLPTGESSLPTVTEDGLWYVQDGALWLLPLHNDDPEARREPRRLTMLPRASDRSVGLPLQVSPAGDGGRVAYRCGPALCLIDRDGSNHTVAVSDTRFVALAWRPDGEQLAAVFWEYEGTDGRPATLRLLNRDGTIDKEIAVAPDGPVDPPQWTPDGHSLFLQTFPHDGRRIVRVDTVQGMAIDLSQPRWDAFFALHPDGDKLLLSNGRGGFWLAAVDPTLSPSSLYPTVESAAKMRSASSN